MIQFKRRSPVDINSSSMADIAFLLLIFFLVTTTISMDQGINLVLPSEGNEMKINPNNITIISINLVKFLIGFLYYYLSIHLASERL